MSKLETFVNNMGLSMPLVRDIVDDPNMYKDNYVIDFATQDTSFRDGNFGVDRVSPHELEAKLEDLIEKTNDTDIIVEWYQLKLGV